MEFKMRFFSQLITALSLMMDLVENRKLYHAWRVAVLSERLAREILPEYRAEIFYAGLLHDIGAISLPNHVVHYTDPKEHINNPILLNHPKKGAEIVKEIAPLNLSSEMILDHHERWDGRGYPRGLSGDRINVGSQILFVSDIFDILARSNPGDDFKDMAEKLKAKSGSEISHLMCELIISVLGKHGFYEEIMDESKIPEMVLEVVKTLPPLNIKSCRDGIHSAVRVFASVIDAKHRYTGGHSERVANYTFKISKAFGFDKIDVEKFELAAYLHDAGKVAIPRTILDKPAPLTLSEFELMKKHPVYTMEIISMVDALKNLVLISGAHHERYDGTGYPDGISGDNIPVGSRIMAVADAFDAMTSIRPYQRRCSFEEAKQVLAKNAMTQFDAEIVRTAVKVLP